MATALTMVTGALRLIGQLAEGETPSSETAADALSAMNQMLDSWSTERLSVYATQDQTFTWPANTSNRTLGPTGNFVGTRPIRVDDSTYFVDTSNSQSFPIKLLNEDQYNAIALKSNTSTYPQYMWVNMVMPNISMTLYPVPTMALAFHIVSVLELTQPALLATTLSIPPGYLRAFRYNLACEIAAEFGVEPPPTVQRIAMTSKRDIRRINNPNDQLSMPAAIMRRGGRYNIFTGDFN